MGPSTTLPWAGQPPERTREQVAADYTFIELDAGHWLPETRPREVAHAILERRRTVRQ